MKELRLKKTKKANEAIDIDLTCKKDYFDNGEEAYSICNIDNETLFIRKEKNATMVDSYLTIKEKILDWETMCTLKEANKILKKYGYKIIKEVV
jgi:hypothetical protein